ncbi:hypothetical protein PITC_099700 [Penicillium italicum]|uniref:Uncharacterized protein n=1 Tax=Penicillium italicum TaxID=40296 RepID=A0A0A2LB23_PENIT|nr:hypothetical protein PITC_099700 [Penicillium italicum]
MQHDNLLHNPVLAITAPSPKMDLEHGASDLRIHTIISLAVHLRSIITNARSMNCLRPITEHQRNARGAPVTLRTNFLVTSWSHIPLRTTKFQMQNNEKIQAIYTHPILRTTGLFRKLGIQLENSLVTSNDRNGGFWVHGIAESSVWEELADLAGIKK